MPPSLSYAYKMELLNLILDFMIPLFFNPAYSPLEAVHFVR
jgi:hypothetical protein